MKHAVLILLIVLLNTFNAFAGSENDSYSFHMCVERNKIELDDGLTSAEIIGESIVKECQNECMALGRESAVIGGTHFNAELKDSFVKSCVKFATKEVLQSRTDKKRQGIVDSYYIGNWHYEHSNNEIGHRYSLTALMPYQGLFVIECVDSKDTKKSANGPSIKLVVMDYEVKNFIAFQTGNSDGNIIKFNIKFDAKRNPKKNLYWLKQNDHLAILLGDQLYQFIEELKKSKTLTIIANPEQPSLSIDLEGFTQALNKLTGHCKNYYKDTK